MADGPAERADGVMLLAPAPPSTAGAGDSMTAGIAAILARGGDAMAAVRTGAAAGALNVTRHGLGTGNAGTVAALVDHVLVEPWKEAE